MQITCRNTILTTSYPVSKSFSGNQSGVSYMSVNMKAGVKYKISCPDIAGTLNFFIFPVTGSGGENPIFSMNTSNKVIYYTPINDIDILSIHGYSSDYVSLEFTIDGAEFTNHGTISEVNCTVASTGAKVQIQHTFIEGKQYIIKPSPYVTIWNLYSGASGGDNLCVYSRNTDLAFTATADMSVWVNTYSTGGISKLYITEY